MTKPAVIESMHVVDVGNTLFGQLPLRIRIWREEDEVKDEYEWRELEGHLTEKMEVWFQEKEWHPRKLPRRFAEHILGLNRVNAVEVTNAFSGKGIILYKEWP